MDEVIIEQLVDNDLFFFKYEIASMMQDVKQAKQVRFIEKPYVKSQETSDFPNNKSSICQIDKHSFYPFTSRA